MKDAKTKKCTGLGRGLESLLEDNAPVVEKKPAVVYRGSNQETEENRRLSDDLYRKDGTQTNVKKTKRIGS